MLNQTEELASLSKSTAASCTAVPQASCWPLKGSLLMGLYLEWSDTNEEKSIFLNLGIGDRG